jgi:acyl dehydratase
MTSICLLDNLLPSNYSVQSYEIKFLKPIFPQQELTAALTIKGVDFEMKVESMGVGITNVQGRL